MKRALISGITGQDGSYLAEFLLGKDYEVHGLVRRASTSNLSRIEHIQDRLTLHSADLTDPTSLADALEKSDPEEVYNLAAQSFVAESFKSPIMTAEATGLGALRLLQLVKEFNLRIRFYQASSSEQFGGHVLQSRSLQNEETPFKARSPYGAAKIFAHNMAVNYREAYDMFVCCGILFNHESPRRGLEFVTRKITHTLARIKFGKSTRLCLGNLDAKRDWGFAGDYVEAMWLMLQQPSPDDYVVATGITHTVEQFVRAAFDVAIEEYGLGYSVEESVESHPDYIRPAELWTLCGDPVKIAVKLKWKPKTSFYELVKMMVDHDMMLGRAGKL